MLKRCIYAAVLLLFMTVLSLYLAYNIHYFLLGEAVKCTASFFDLNEVLNGLKNTKIRSFFAVFESISAMITLYAFVGRKAACCNGAMRITHEIRTPKPAGNGQFGSAKWLKKSEYRKVFKTVRISKLLKEGMKNGNLHRND